MRKYNLDVSRRGRQFEIEGLHVGDNGLRDFAFTFTMGGEPFPLPEGCIATLFAVLPGEVTVFDPCSVSGDTVTYTLTGGGGDEAGITSCPGRVKCEIRITTAEGEVITSPEFAFLVDRILQDDEAIEAQESFSALTDALGRVIDTEKGLKEALKDIEEAEESLSSKVDRVNGAEGNIVVFGKDGAIGDGGVGPLKQYIFVYDELHEHDESNRAACEMMRADIEAQRPFVAILFDGAICTAAAIDASSTNVTIIKGWFLDFDVYCEITVRSSSILYSMSDTVSAEFSETGKTPASQEAIAGWVKGYVETSLTEKGTYNGTYIVPFYDYPTNAQKEEIAEIVEKLRYSAGKCAVFMDVGSELLPAQYKYIRNDIITAISHNSATTFVYEIVVTPSGAVTTKRNGFFATDMTTNGAETQAPTCLAVMSYVNSIATDERFIDAIISAMPAAEEASF